MFKKLFLLSLVSLFTTTTYGAYTSVDCGSDSVFGQYSCNQCFDGGVVKNGDNISFLDDVWVNDTTNKKIMYKEEQSLPVMNTLNGASFTKNPDNDSFWEYTSEFEALKSEEFDGYVLNASGSVTWLKSSLGSSYLVNSIPAKNENAGILVFDIMSHNILESGEIAMNDKAHKECVLYKAGESTVAQVPAKVVEPQPEQMTQVKTGPELYFLVLMISLLLGFAIMNRKVILEKIRK